MIHRIAIRSESTGHIANLVVSCKSIELLKLVFCMLEMNVFFVWFSDGLQESV